MAGKRKRNKASGLGTTKGRKPKTVKTRAAEPSTAPRDDFKATPVHVQVEVRRTHVAEFLERGVVLQRRIIEGLAARGFTASQGTVAKDIAAIRAEWAEARIEDFRAARDLVRNAALATLREAWEGWERSKQDQVTTRRVVTRKDAGPEGIESAPLLVERKSSAGNPEFITRMQSAINELCRIDGLHAPVKINADGGNLSTLAALMGLDANMLPERYEKS